MADTVSIQLNGAKEFRRALKAAGLFAEKELRKANYAAADAITTKVKLYAPVKTGALRKSIQFRTDNLTATVATDLSYAPYLEHGTRAHGPTSAPFLVFKIGNQWIRTKRVRGIKPRRFFQRGFEAAQRSVEAAYGRALDAIVQFLARST